MTQYCIWYPTGGYGHFINMVLSVYGEDFARPPCTTISFGKNGNSHDLELVAPKYSHDQGYYDFVFDSTKNYSILIDNGIDNESDDYQKLFPSALHIKVCYTDYTWPIVARTNIEKTQQTTIEASMVKENFVDLWPSDEDWCKREKFFLYLRDHPHRHSWRANPNGASITIEDLLSYDLFLQKLNALGIKTADFLDIYTEWHSVNKTYIEPILKARFAIDNINKAQPLNGYSLWDQAITNYFIWLEYGIEIPANDYANWFTNTSEICDLLTFKL